MKARELAEKIIKEFIPAPHIGATADLEEGVRSQDEECTLQVD